MKIIARTASGFLLEATAEEIARVAGVSYGHELKELRTDTIGATIHVGPRWSRMDGIEASSEKLFSIARTLRAIAELLDQQAPGITAAVKSKE